MHGVNSALRAPEYIARIKSGSRPFPADPGIPVCPEVAAETLQCNCTTTTCGAGIADAPGAVAEALRPIARLVSPTGTTAGRNVTLDGSGSAVARGRSVASYSWSVLSGTASFVGTADGDSAVVAVPAAGLSTVRLDVTDDNGATDSAEVTLGTAATSNSGGGGGGGGAPDPFLLAVLLLVALQHRRQV
jgi:serine protease